MAIRSLRSSESQPGLFYRSTVAYQPGMEPKDEQIETIDLVFDDYYPNGEIILAVKRQLELNGIVVSTKTGNYHEPAVITGDLRLFVADNLFPNSLKLYYDIGLIARRLLSANEQAEYWFLLDKLESVRDEGCKREAKIALENYIYEYALIIPIGRFQKNFLAKPMLKDKFLNFDFV